MEDNERKIYNTAKDSQYIQIQPNSDTAEKRNNFSEANYLNDQKLSLNGKSSNIVSSEGHISKQSTFQLAKNENELLKSAESPFKDQDILEIREKNKSEQEHKEGDNSDYIITLRNLHKTYLIGVEGVPALRGVSLKIKRGEFLVILGTSGGGKTTLLNLIGTIDCPSRGDMKIFDQTVRSNTEDSILSAIRLEKIAFVFQNFNLLQNLNVLENVELPMKIKGSLSSDEITKRAMELLTMVGLKDRIKHFPNQLSGGEQQRVTISRALSNRPEILLLDEPTGDLDTKNSDIVMNILMNLNIKDNITMIMVTHDVALKHFGNRVVKIVDGKVNSIETIPRELREDSINKLTERINNIQTLGIKEGGKNSEWTPADDGSSQFNKPSMTFVRKITDYSIKRNHNK